MNKLNFLGSMRDKNRRKQDRRHSSRRTINYIFGSEKWIQAVRSSYLFWPNQDRRTQERRGVTRRIVERRTRLQKYRDYASRQLTTSKQLKVPLLTDEERQMLNDLNRRH